MLAFSRNYFFLFLIMLLVEIGIALFVSDNIIRPYLGDLLVVILLYSFLKAFLQIKVAIAAFAVLLFAYVVEFLQYIKIVKLLELDGQRVATTILGTQFDWLDMLAYTTGGFMILMIEHWRSRRFFLQR